MPTKTKEPARVGIVMPCFNLGKFIEEAVDSLLTQTFTDYEVYIVDDASTDIGTIETIKRLEKTLPENFTIDFQRENRGMNKVTNYVAKKLRNEYLLIFSPDDILENTFLAETVSYLDSHSEFAAVCTWLKNFGEYNYITRYSEKTATLPAMLVKNNFCGCSLIRKSIWDKFKGYDESPTQRLHQDYEFWVRLLAANLKLGVIEKPLLRYRIRYKSLSRTPDFAVREEWADYFVNKHLNLYTKYAPEVISGMLKNSIRIAIGRESIHQENSQLRKEFEKLRHDAYTLRRIRRHPLFKYLGWVKKLILID